MHLTDPYCPLSLFNAAVSLHEAGGFSDSVKLLEAAYGRKRDDWMTLMHLAQGYNVTGRHLEAVEAAEEVLVLKPDSADIYTFLGLAYAASHKMEEAESAWRKALDLDPGNTIARENLALQLQGFGDQEKADEIYASLENKSINYETAMPRIVPAVEWIEARRNKAGVVLDAFADNGVELKPEQIVACPPFFLAYHAKKDVGLLRKYSRALLACCPALRYRAPHCGTERPDNSKKRIGFISQCLRPGHPVAMCFSGAIERIAESAETFVIGPNVADMGKAKAVSLPYGMEAAAKAVAGLELDLLVYTDLGMNAETWYLAHMRLARAQAVMAGHPNTTGIPNVDYFISCKLFEPEGAEEHYSENLIKLDVPPVWVKRFQKPERLLTRADLGLREDKYLYAVPMTIQKLHPDFDLALAEILRRDPEGVAVMFEDPQYPIATRALVKRMEKTMADVLDRVEFRKFYPKDQFLHFCANVDVVLDPFHFGAGTTAYYIFAAGAPCVTWPGEFMRGRVTAGLYAMMGVPDLIARDHAHYVELAFRVTRDEAFNRDVRGRISKNCGALFENEGGMAQLAETLIDLIK